MTVSFNYEIYFSFQFSGQVSCFNNKFEQMSCFIFNEWINFDSKLAPVIHRARDILHRYLFIKSFQNVLAQATDTLQSKYDWFVLIY